MKKDFVSLKDLNKKEIEAIFKKADLLKKTKSAPLKGKSLALIFQKPSMRTRVSFEVGMFQLGGQSINLGPEDIQLGVREKVSDIAQVLSRYLDGIVARTFSHEDVVLLASHASIPVINGLSDAEHPCQALADLYTVRNYFGDLRKVKIAYVGDGNNVCNSLMHGAAVVGATLSIAAPKNYEPPRESVRNNIFVFNDPKEAVRGADVVYTDVWTSMGQEKEKEERLQAFRGFQVNESLMSLAKPNAKFMHCLPAHRGEEVSESVLEGKHSIVLDQAENRLHVQKAILVMLLGKKS